MTEQERNEILEGLPSNLRKTFSKLLDVIDKKLESKSKNTFFKKESETKTKKTK